MAENDDDAVGSERTARSVIADYLGEGPIAFPELVETIQRVGNLSRGDAVVLAKSTLQACLVAGEITVQRGCALDEDLVAISDREARQVVQDVDLYSYGDGNECRAWFTV